MSNIIACNADGSTKAAAEQPKQTGEPLELRPFPDGSFIKYADRPLPKGVVSILSTQKILFNYKGQTLALSANKEIAEFLCMAVETFCQAAHQVQQEKQRAIQEANADADVLSGTVRVEELHETQQ